MSHVPHVDASNDVHVLAVSRIITTQRQRVGIDAARHRQHTAHAVFAIVVEADCRGLESLESARDPACVVDQVAARTVDGEELPVG